MLNRLNEIVKYKISDEETVNKVMEVANQHELTHNEYFLIKCFGIAFLFHSKIKWTLDNYNLTGDYNGLWYMSVKYPRYSYSEEKMITDICIITMKSNATLNRMFSTILSITPIGVNVEYNFCPCKERIVKGVCGEETKYSFYENLNVYYKLIVKEDEYNNLPKNYQINDKSLSVGDGIAVTAAMAGMGGILAAPLLFL